MNTNEENIIFTNILYNDIEIDLLLNMYGATHSIFEDEIEQYTNFNFNKGE